MFIRYTSLVAESPGGLMTMTLSIRLRLLCAAATLAVAPVHATDLLSGNLAGTDTGNGPTELNENFSPPVFGAFILMTGDATDLTPIPDGNGDGRRLPSQYRDGNHPVGLGRSLGDRGRKRTVLGAPDVRRRPLCRIRQRGRQSGVKRHQRCNFRCFRAGYVAGRDVSGERGSERQQRQRRVRSFRRRHQPRWTLRRLSQLRHRPDL